MSVFQTVVLGIFVAFIVAGVAVFAIFSGFAGGGNVGAVTIWGTMDQGQAQQVIDTLRNSDETLRDVSYVQKAPQTYEQDLVNAIAAGQGPDLFFVTQENAYFFSDKIIPIPYSTVSQASFMGSYVDEGQLFLSSQGSLALPLLIDPLVMYWNRDLYAAASTATPPAFWNDLIELAPKITSVDNTSGVKKSAVALGAWQNIANAKAILSTLMMQAGSSIVARTEQGGLQSTLGTIAQGAAENPSTSALRFYTEFANPSKQDYSWNRSLPEAQDEFSAGVLATYFGFASEYQTLVARNPNLRFGVAPVPQIEGQSSKLTFGTITGLATSRAAHNPSGAMVVAQHLSGTQGAMLFAQAAGLPSVRRDAQVDTSQNATLAAFVQSALMARGWLDPNAPQTDRIFKTMIESVASGQNTPAEAVGEADQELQKLLPF